MLEKDFFKMLTVPVSEEQKAIITSSEEVPTSVIASAGSGKTTTSISKMLYQIYVDGVNPNNILAVTFSRNAKKDMEKRFKELSKPFSQFEESQETPNFYTFHGLFLKLIKSTSFGVGLHIGNPQQFYSQLFRLLKFKSVSDNYKTLDNIFNAYSSIINNSITPDGLHNYEGETLAYDKLFQYDIFDIGDYISVINGYNQIKKEQGIIDFDDMQILLYMFLLNDSPENMMALSRLVNNFNMQYRSCYFDEFQDISNLQYNIIDLLLTLERNTGWNNTVVIGDPNQAIYGFRGSNADLLNNFAKEHNGKELFLSTNYRCPDNILNPVLNVVDNKKTPSAFNSGGKIEFKENTQEMFSELKKLSENKDETTAIIARQNSNICLIADFLAQNDIPVKTTSDAQVLDNNKFFKDIVGVISLAKTHTRKLLKKMAYRLFNFDCEAYYEYPVKTKDINDFVDDEKCYHSLVLQNKNILAKKKSAMKTLETSNDMETLLQKAKFLLMPYYQKLINELFISNEEVNQTFDYLINNYADDSYQDFIRKRVKIKNNLKEWHAKRKVITCYTVHAVKGLEFDNVFFIGINRDNIPNDISLSKRIQEDDIQSFTDSLTEERHIFYVAWTRAKKRLIVNYNGGIQSCLFLREVDSDIPKIEHCDRISAEEYYKEVAEEKNIKVEKKSNPLEEINEDDLFSQLFDD